MVRNATGARLRVNEALDETTTDKLAKELVIHMCRENTLYSYISHGVGHVRAHASNYSLEDWIRVWGQHGKGS